MGSNPIWGLDFSEFPVGSISNFISNIVIIAMIIMIIIKEMKVNYNKSIHLVKTQPFSNVFLK